MFEAALLLLATLSVVAPTAIGARYGLIPIASPMHIVAIFAFLGCLVKTVAYVWDERLAYFYTFQPSRESILLGYNFFFLFTLSIVLGYWIRARKFLGRTVKPHRLFQHVALIRSPIVLTSFGLGTAAIAIGMLFAVQGLDEVSFDSLARMNSSRIQSIDGVEGFGRSNAMVKSLLILVLFSFYYALADYLMAEKKSSMKTIILIVSFLATVFAITSIGDRMKVFELLLGAVTVIILTKGKFGVKAFLLSFAGVLLALLLVVFLTELRKSGGTAGTVGLVWRATAEQIISSTYFYDVNMSVLIIDRLENFDWLYGETYFRWLYGWIPRDLWPTKPAVTLGPFVKMEVLGQYGTVGGINPTGPGEAMINFGIAGVFVGLIIGWVFRVIEVSLLTGRRISILFSPLLYPSLFIPFIATSLQSSFSAYVVGVIPQLILVVIVVKMSHYRFVLRSKRSPHA